MRDFFPGTEPPPSQHRLSETNFKLAVPQQDLPSRPERMETSFVSGKVLWVQVGMLPALPDLRGFTAVLSSCFKKTGKRKQKARYPFLLVPVLPVLRPTSAQPGWELPAQPGRGTWWDRVFTDALVKEQLCHVEEELVFLTSPVFVTGAWALPGHM